MRICAIFMFFFSILFSSQSFAQQSEQNTTMVESYNPTDIEKLVNYIWKRFPGMSEVAYDISVVAVAETLFPAQVKQLGKNPAAKTVFRDGGKVPSTLAKVQAGVQVGKTGFTYQVDHIYSQFLKVFGKLSCIFLFPAVGISENAEAAALLANYPSELLPRVVLIAGKEWQKSGMKTPFEDYFYENLSSSWFFDALQEVPPKVYAMEALGGTVGRLGIQAKIFQAVISGANLLLPYQLNSMQPFYQNPGIWRTPLNLVVFFTAVSVSNGVVTYILTPPARLIMDGMQDSPWVDGFIVGIMAAIWAPTIKTWLFSAGTYAFSVVCPFMIGMHQRFFHAHQHAE